MNIKVLLNSALAKAPTKTNNSDAGWDLYSIEEKDIKARTRSVIRTGIHLEIPNNMAGLIWPRSGLSVKHGIDVLAGVIDSGYRGEIMVCLYNTSEYDVMVHHGDRIAQIIFQEVPDVTMLVVSDTLGTSQRGDHGFGSSGS
jgi:dUTP pyrophosphatase